LEADTPGLAILGGSRFHVCRACGLRAERQFGVGSARASATGLARSYRKLSVPLLPPSVVTKTLTQTSVVIRVAGNLN